MIEVRIANRNDAPIICQITQEAFESSRSLLNPPAGALSETLEELHKVIADGAAVIALLDNKPAGACRMIIFEDHVYCGRLAVFPSMQGKGVGTAILNFLEQEARNRRLPEVRLATRDVLTSNVEYYQRLGYVITGREKHHHGSDIVVDFAKRI